MVPRDPVSLEKLSATSHPWLLELCPVPGGVCETCFLICCGISLRTKKASPSMTQLSASGKALPHPGPRSPLLHHGRIGSDALKDLPPPPQSIILGFCEPNTNPWFQKEREGCVGEGYQMLKAQPPPLPLQGLSRHLEATFGAPAGSNLARFWDQSPFKGRRSLSWYVMVYGHGDKCSHDKASSDQNNSGHPWERPLQEPAHK